MIEFRLRLSEVILARALTGGSMSISEWSRDNRHRPEQVTATASDTPIAGRLAAWAWARQRPLLPSKRQPRCLHASKPKPRATRNIHNDSPHPAHFRHGRAPRPDARWALGSSAWAGLDYIQHQQLPDRGSPCGLGLGAPMPSLSVKASAQMPARVRAQVQGDPQPPNDLPEPPHV